MQNYLKHMLFGLFLRFSMVDADAASDPTLVADGSAKTLPDKVPAGRDFKALGAADAKEIEAKRAEGDAFARQRYIERAKELAGLPAGKDWIEGYASTFSDDKNNGTRKRVKSELTALFEAWVSPVSGTIDEARDKLENFAGGYHDWMALAREIRGKKGTGRPEGAFKVKATDADMKKIAETLPIMNPVQALDVRQKAVAAIAKQPNSEIAIIRSLISSDLALLAKSDDAGIRRIAEETIERFHGVLAAHDKEEEERKAAEAAKREETHKQLAADSNKQEQKIETPQPAQGEAQQQTGTHG